VGLLMSEVTPADLAMVVLKGGLGRHLAEKDKVEKFAPLAYAIPAAFSAYGAWRGSGGQLFDDDWNWDPRWEDTARYEDPLTGGMIMGEDGVYNPGGIGEIEDANWAQRAGGATLGALQGVNPYTYFRGAGKGAQAAGAASQTRRLKAGVESAEAANDAARLYGQGMGRLADQSAEQAMGIGSRNARQGNILFGGAGGHGSRNFLQGAGHYSRAGLENAAIRAGGKHPFKVFPSMRREINPSLYVDDAGKVATNMGRRAQVGWPSRFGHLVGRGAQLYGHEAGDAAAALAAALWPTAIGGGDGNVDIPMGGTEGYAGGAGGAGFGGQMGGGGYGPMGNVTQGYSQGTPHDLIWNPEMAQGTGATWDDAFVARPEYGQGQQIRTSENMNIGEQLLKDAKKDMEKPPKGKKGGMILIIGHGGKSGKDDKKDSPC